MRIYFVGVFAGWGLIKPGIHGFLGVRGIPGINIHHEAPSA
jgi:hypothetical protein